MPKHKTELTPEVRAAYEAAMDRIRTVTGFRTQVQLAEVLGVRQSSISDAKRRASIPPEWQLKIMRLHQVNPDWLLTGRGAQFLGDMLPEKINRLGRVVTEVQLELHELKSTLGQAILLAGMTNDELAAHKEKAAQQLQLGLSHVLAMTAKIDGARDVAGMGA